MRRIIINERDLTSNVETLSSYDVAYVPGFTSIEGSEYYQTPTLFTSRYEFQQAIGIDPPTFSTIQNYPKADGSDTLGFNLEEEFGITDPSKNEVMFRAGEVDPGYKIAQYLLSLGMPVYYEVMNNTSSNITVAKMYTELARRFKDGDGSFDTPGDYSVKFLTSGGYPTYGYGATTTRILNATGTGVTKTVTKSTEDPTILVLTCKFPFAPDKNTAGTTFATTLKYDGTALYEEDGESNVDVTSSINGKELTFYIKYGTDGNITKIGNSTTVDQLLDNASDRTTLLEGLTISYSYESAGEATMPLVSSMINLARTRGDAIALIDHVDNPNRDLTISNPKSVISSVRDKLINFDALSYGAMFTPWYVCSSQTYSTVLGTSENIFPGSVAYLSALAVQLRDHSPWLAVSGVTRGRVPNLVKPHCNKPLTNNIADSYQTIPGESIESLGTTQISINPITYIRGIGYCIMGNRTLRNNASGTTALSFLNIRSTVTDIKKAIYDASIQMIFEQNTEVTWINFKDKITPLLDRMLSNYILDDYTITRYLIDPETGNEVPAYKVLGVIRIRPINSIEVFDLTVQLENNELAVTEI